MPTEPADHLTKLPRRVHVGIYADDSLAVTHEQAVADLEAEQGRLDASRPRRIAEQTATSVDSDAALAAVDTQDEAALAPLKAAVDAALAALDAATIWFTLQSIGRRRFRDLHDAHPPTDVDHEDAAKVGATASYNPETFGPALFHASLVCPAMTRDDVDAMWAGGAAGEWNETEIAMLFACALDANTQARRVTTTGKGPRTP
jgi:hypothetical protein